MDRRSFIKAVSAFVVVATVAPETLATQPVDWAEWNNIEMIFERETVTKLLINGKDFSRSREARLRLAEMIHFDGECILIGCRREGQWLGVQTRLADHFPDRFKVGFQLRLTNESPLPSYATNGNAVSDLWTAGWLGRA